MEPKEIVIEGARDIMRLMRGGLVEPAIDRYETLVQSLGLVNYANDREILTLMLDMEFLVYEHPLSSVEEVERDLINVEAQMGD